MSWLEKHITLQIYDDKKAERENAYTHFLGSFLSLIGLILVLIKFDETHSLSLKVGFIIFALSNILLYTASGLYHYLPRNNFKRVCRILDHCNIYFLIAGTYTPILLYINNSLTIKLTAFMWILSLLGILFTLYFWGRLKPLHPILYLIMGWMIIFFYNDIIPHLPSDLIKYLFLGGVTYSIGVIFYALKKLPHYHAIWHLFVLLGSIFFYVGLYKTLL